jgi:hypothetical protein
MTLLISWIGVDSRKVSSLYIASDSRVSWTSATTFDSGRKVYGCVNHPIIIGYCGDVLFPSIVLGQVVEAADSRVLFNEGASGETMLAAVESMIKRAIMEYPIQLPTVAADSVEFILAVRGPDGAFSCRTLLWTRATNAWQGAAVAFAPYSNTLVVLGSGSQNFMKKFAEYQRGNDRKTSRAAYQCLCHTLAEGRDAYCGGAPQLVGLYNKFPARRFGIIHKKKRFLHGAEIPDDAELNFSGVEWRNERFEICDGATKQIMLGAQRQPNALRP